MTPATAAFELLAAAPPILREWLKKNKRKVSTTVGLSLLEGYWRHGLSLAPQTLKPDGTAAGLVSASTRDRETQTERAVRYLWEQIGADGQAFSLSGLHAGVDSGSAFVATIRSRALASAQNRSTAAIPGVEHAYSELLRWLSTWDGEFSAAQQAALQRYEAACARVAAIREHAPAAPAAPDARPRASKSRTRAAVEVHSTLESPAERLVRQLQEAQGSVLSGGVREVAPRRFKAYESALFSAWARAGGEASDLVEHIRKGDVEVLTEEGGYSGGKMGATRAKIVEFVVHPFAAPAAPAPQVDAPQVPTKPGEVRSLARRLQEGLAASGWQFFRDTQAPVWDDRASVAVDTVRGGVDMVLTNGTFYITFRWRAATDTRAEHGYFMVEWAEQPGGMIVGTRRVNHIKFETLPDGLKQLATYLADNPGPKALPDTSARVAQLVDGFAALVPSTTKQNPASPAPAVAAIRAALTPELLKEPYRSRVLRGECSPLTGHCYVASEAYYHLHGGKAAGLKPMSIQHEGGPHWWIRDASGRDIDLTAEQFTTPVPYAQGVGKGFLTTVPSKRAQVVMDRVAGAPKANPAEPAWLSLATVLAVEPHIESSGISEVARSPRGFLRAYEAAGGAPGRLGQDAHSGQDWRSRRNAFVARHVAQAKANGEPWWQDGAPTGRHLALVAWAYTPTPDRLHAWVRSGRGRLVRS